MAIRKVRTHLLYTWWDLLLMDSRTWRFFKVHMCLLLIKEVLCLLILTENSSFLDTGVSRRKTDSWKVFSPYQAQYGWGTAADVLSRNRHFFVGIADFLASWSSSFAFGWIIPETWFCAVHLLHEKFAVNSTVYRPRLPCYWFGECFQKTFCGYGPFILF